MKKFWILWIFLIIIYWERFKEKVQKCLRPILLTVVPEFHVTFVQIQKYKYLDTPTDFKNISIVYIFLSCCTIYIFLIRCVNISCPNFKN